MKCFAVLFLITAVLAGCAAQVSMDACSAAPIAAPVSLYDPNSPAEAATRGAVQCFPIGESRYDALFRLGDQLAVVAYQDGESTVLTISADTGTVLTSASFPFPIRPGDPSFRLLDTGFSVYDEVSGQIHLLDNSLLLTASISAPSDLSGNPMLSSDTSTLYYCTDKDIRALELSSGISRILKESAYPDQTLSGIYLDDGILHCTYSDNGKPFDLFLSTQNGATLHLTQHVRQLITTDTFYYAQLQQGNHTPWFFGSDNTPTQMLLGDLMIQILPQLHAAVEICPLPAGGHRVDFLSLESGQKTASVQLRTMDHLTGVIADIQDQIWLLGQDSSYKSSVLYRWDPKLSPVNNNTQYLSDYAPDVSDGDPFAQCLDYVQLLNERYGIRVLIREQVTHLQPQDCQFTPEPLLPVIEKELKQLERHLAAYPEGFIQTLADRFDGLTICLVRSLSSTPEGQDGLQFWNENQACIALCSGTGSQRALYHGICHLIDTIVLNECSAYDTWSQLNPTGFQYDYDYTTNANRNSTAYLLESSRYFVDMFSMSFPKEDRARIMEYAMTPGNRELFQGEAMQKKLATVCLGIRKAFGLEEWEEPLIWEQYLNSPLIKQ